MKSTPNMYLILVAYTHIYVCLYRSLPVLLLVNAIYDIFLFFHSFIKFLSFSSTIDSNYISLEVIAISEWHDDRVVLCQPPCIIFKVVCIGTRIIQKLSSKQIHCIEQYYCTVTNYFQWDVLTWNEKIIIASRVLILVFLLV